MNEPNTMSPIPWEIRHYESGILEGLNYIADANGKAVATLGVAANEADGNVLMAAPYLLAALEEIEAHHVKNNARVGRPVGNSHTIAVARAAIAKAKGSP